LTIAATGASIAQGDSEYSSEEGEMKKNLTWVYLPVLVIAACSLPGFVRASEIEGIPAGTDYLHTMAAIVSLGAPIGTVTLFGIPDPAHFGADTVVDRLNDAMIPDVIGDTATVNTTMTELQLTSAPGAVMGLTMLVTLAGPSTGQITFTQTVNGEGMPEGTFNSFFDVFFDVSFEAPTGGPVNCTQFLPSDVCTQTARLTGSGSWTDDNGYLWLVGAAAYNSPTENHVVTQLQTPEPACTILIAAGLGIVALRRRRRSLR
jgi:hypothetical protein